MIKTQGFLATNKSPLTFMALATVYSSWMASADEIVDRNSVVRQILKVILRQFTNSRKSS